LIFVFVKPLARKKNSRPSHQPASGRDQGMRALVVLLQVAITPIIMMNTKLETFAGLECLSIDNLPEGTSPSHLVVICHGFGANKDDLASFGPELLGAHESISAKCRFYFPNAPMDLASLGMPGGRAWWEINMAQLAMINQTRDFSELTLLTPAGMLEASEQLAKAVREIQQSCGLKDDSLTLGGFSQGAMISTDLVLRHGFVPQQLLVFSGTLLCRDDWTKFAADHSGCPVLQSHGRIDPVLPFEPSESLRDMLTDNGFDVTFLPFDGVHTVPMEALQQLASDLANLT